jgi:hypothetical protein
MRERERVGEWWIEVRPRPSCSGGRGVSLLGWCCGREEDGWGLKGARRTVGILQGDIFCGGGGWDVQTQT